MVITLSSLRSPERHYCCSAEKIPLPSTTPPQYSFAAVLLRVFSLALLPSSTPSLFGLLPSNTPPLFHSQYSPAILLGCFHGKDTQSTRLLSLTDPLSTWLLSPTDSCRLCQHPSLGEGSPLLHPTCPLATQSTLYLSTQLLSPTDPSTSLSRGPRPYLSFGNPIKKLPPALQSWPVTPTPLPYLAYGSYGEKTPVLAPVRGSIVKEKVCQSWNNIT